MRSNPKKFWHYVKHSRSESLGIPSLRKDNNIYISAKDKAETLSQHFQRVFTQDNGSLPDLGPPLCPGIDNIIFTESGIRKLDSLSTCNASDPDGIPSCILHDLSAEISDTLCFLFQQSYDTGQLPDDWLVAMLVPVYKKDQRSNPANYRPISLTSLVSKVMEHCVLSQIHKHLNANNIITPLQRGFRAGFSCETQLIMALHDWATTLNNHGQVDAIMLDFRKAFDKVSHAKPIHRLKHYGIQGKTRLWLAAFLTKRSQFVAADGSHSSHLEVVSGVPQGTVLGPTLFLLFINDIVDRSDSTIRLFADDSVVYREISSPSDHACLQYDLSSTRESFKSECDHLKMMFTNLKHPHSLIDSTISHYVTSVGSQSPGVQAQLSTNENAVHRVVLSFKDQKSAGAIKRQLSDLSNEINHTLQPVFKSRKICEDLKMREPKPPIINQQCVV